MMMEKMKPMTGKNDKIIKRLQILEQTYFPKNRSYGK